MTDTIADFIIRLKNASMAGNREVRVFHSQFKENLARILKAQGIVERVEVVGEIPKKQLVLHLPVKDGKVRAIEVKRISKPGKRVYLGAKEIRPATRGLGVTIFSTPQGLMTEKEAIKKGVGGEVVCKII